MNTAFISAYVQVEKKSLSTSFSIFCKKLTQKMKTQEKKILKTKLVKSLISLGEMFESFLFLIVPKIRKLVKQLNAILRLETFLGNLKKYLAKNILQSLTVSVFLIYLILNFV